MLSSQQGTQLSHYMLDKYLLNPAYAGLDYSLSATALIRSQYSELPGNPNSQFLAVNLPFAKWNGGLGVMLKNERLGAFNETGFYTSYAYQLETNDFILSGALRVGLVSTRLSGDDLITPGGEYEGTIINHNDPLLDVGLLRGAVPDLGIAIYFRNRFIEGGLSLDRLWSRSLKFDDLDIEKNIELGFYVQSSFSNGGALRFIPSLLMKTDAIELQTDLNLLVKYNGNVFGGIGIRGYNSTSIDAISVLGGLKLNSNYTLTYSYDIGVSDLRHFNEGGHEISLNYNLNKLIGVGRDPRIIYNPRHL